MSTNRPRLRTRTALLLTVLAVTQFAFPACSAVGDDAAAGDVAPLTDGAATSTAAPLPTGPPLAQEPDPQPDVARPAVEAAPPVNDALAIAVEALRRYDEALTAIAADPVASTQIGDARLTAWFGAVAATSTLTSDLLHPLRADAVHDGAVVIPGPSGLSWVHHAVSATELDGRISFSWCGWSPGIVRRATTGEVLDDLVAVSAGTGELVAHDGIWLIDELLELESRVEPAGTPDACTGPDPDPGQNP